MSFAHFFDPAAFIEYKEALIWYQRKSQKAAENFVIEVTASVRLICKDPLRYRNTYKEFRETSVKKFPYSIVYYFDKAGQRIVIFSVYHHRRSPKRKFKSPR